MQINQVKEQQDVILQDLHQQQKDLELESYYLQHDQEFFYREIRDKWRMTRAQDFIIQHKEVNNESEKHA